MFSLVSRTRFGFVQKVMSLFHVHICGGRGWNKGSVTCLRNGVYFLKPNGKIVKVTFPFFCSIFDQNMDVSDLYSEWKQLVSAFGSYLIASGLSKKEDNIQRATLLHCLGPAEQRIFNTLPGKHEFFTEVKTAIDGYFAPKRNIVAEHYKFWSQVHRADEFIDTYLTTLRELTKSCDFGTLEEEMISDQIVKKCNSKTLQEKLLQQEKLDLSRMIKLERSEENATQDSLLIASGTKENPIPIDRILNNQKEPGKTTYASYRCGGKDGHSPNECGAINSRCNGCKKIGLLQKDCCSQPKGAESNSNQNRQRQTSKEAP